MSVWQPVDKTNIAQIVRGDNHEVFRSPSGSYWYRLRSPQEAAELRVLKVEHHPDETRLNDALTIAPAGVRI